MRSRTETIAATAARVFIVAAVLMALATLVGYLVATEAHADGITPEEQAQVVAASAALAEYIAQPHALVRATSKRVTWAYPVGVDRWMCISVIPSGGRSSFASPADQQQRMVTGTLTLDADQCWAWAGFP